MATDVNNVRYIDAIATEQNLWTILRRHRKEYGDPDGRLLDLVRDCVASVREQPTIALPPDKPNGKWVKIESEDPSRVRLACSMCGFDVSHPVREITHIPFCWNCGTSMHRENGGEE